MLRFLGLLARVPTPHLPCPKPPPAPPRAPIPETAVSVLFWSQQSRLLEPPLKSLPFKCVPGAPGGKKAGNSGTHMNTPPKGRSGVVPHKNRRSHGRWLGGLERRAGRGGLQIQGSGPYPPPLCDIPSGCCSFTGPWTVTRSSLHMLRRVAAFCTPPPRRHVVCAPGTAGAGGLARDPGRSPGHVVCTSAGADLRCLRRKYRDPWRSAAALGPSGSGPSRTAGWSR